MSQRAVLYEKCEMQMDDRIMRAGSLTVCSPGTVTSKQDAVLMCKNKLSALRRIAYQKIISVEHDQP